jgi:hypothetical protein
VFTLGFEKIADNAATGGTNNQGLEFKSSDSFNSSTDVGAGGQAPPSKESYQPSPKKTVSQAKEKKKMMPDELGEYFMHKGAAAGSRVTGRKMDNGTSEDSWTNGHKYESSTPDSTAEGMMASIKEEKARRKAYVKASLK